MKGKINYKSNWMPIKKAFSLFPDENTFLMAAKEGNLKTKGRFQDDARAHEYNEQKDLDTASWQTCVFDPKTMKLNGSSDDAWDYCYYDIEVSRPDMMRLFILHSDQFSPSGMSELSQAILTVFLDLIEEKGGNIPSTPQVWRALQKRYKEFPCIISMSSEKDGAIEWKGLESDPKPQPYGTFKNLLTRMRKAIKPVLS